MKRFYLATVGLAVFLQALPALATTRYMSPYGAFANGGTSPSAANAYKNVAQLARTNMVSSDLGLLCPGRYGEAIVCLTTWTSLVTFRGDPLNTSGFTDGSANLVAPGPVIITGRTTSDTTAGAGSATWNMNGKNNARFENIYFEGAFGQPAFHATTQTSTNLQFYKCALVAAGNGGYSFDTSIALGVVPYHQFTKCFFFASGNVSANCISVLYSSGNTLTTNWDSGSYVVDSVAICNGYTTFGYLRSNGLTNVMAGYGVTNCFVLGTYCIACDNSAVDRPWPLRGNIFFGAAQCIANNSTAQIDSDYNQYFYGSSLGGGTVTKGAHDHDNDYAFRMDFGTSQMWGLGDQPCFSPMAGSPLVAATLNYTTTDMNGLARGSANSFGAMEKYVPPGRGY